MAVEEDIYDGDMKLGHVVHCGTDEDCEHKLVDRKLCKERDYSP
ncbi:MAG: hypothetical protein ABEK17_03755 [Candidatus Aenigmatarchaeota archaeon]